MPAIVSYQTDYMPQPWSGYYPCVGKAQKAFNGVALGDTVATITSLSIAQCDRYYALLEDTQAKPTWSEMVDHWVWYFTRGMQLDTIPHERYIRYFNSDECYALLHEMLGQHDAPDEWAYSASGAIDNG